MNKLKKTLPYIFLICIYLINIYMIFNYARFNLDSDMSSEMVLAKLMNEHKDIFFCEDWCYSTEIRFIYLQIFFRIGLLIFPNNYIYARTLGMAIALLVLVLSFIHLTKTLNLGSKSIWITSLLISPISYIYYKIVLFGGSYIPHLIIYILITDLIIMYKKNNKLIYLILLILLGITGGLNGVRILYSYLVPLISITLLINYSFNNKLILKEYLNKLIKDYKVVIITSISILIGFMINYLYLSKVYTFRNYVSNPISNLSLNTILDRLSDGMILFGYAGGNKLLSIGGIASIFSLLFNLILIYILIKSLLNYKSMIKENNKPLFIFTIGLIVMIIEFSIIFNVMGESQINYWIPIVPFTLIGIALYIKEYKENLLLVLVIISLYITSLYPLAYTYNTSKDDSKMEVVDYLLSNQIYEGYGSFWSSNVLKELSNGKIDIWTTGDYLEYTNTYNVYEWLQEKRHLTSEPTCKSFLIVDINRDEIDTFIIEDKLEYSNNTYKIYVFDKYEEIKDYMNNRFNY